MSDTLYTDEEIKILQNRIINYISNTCLKCEKLKTKPNNKCCFQTFDFNENHKKILSENLQRYKIIACNIKYKSENYMKDNFGSNGQSMRTKESMYIHYINIHGELYANNFTGKGNLAIEYIINMPFCSYQEYKSIGSFQGNENYEILYGLSHTYIKKTFIIPKYILNIILMTEYFDKINIITSRCDSNPIIYLNNIYIHFMKYIINYNNVNYNRLFYHSSDIDLENIVAIENTNKKEIDEYYDTIEKERQKIIQGELDRMAREEQEKLEKLDRIAKEKQAELDRIAKEKKDKIDKDNDIKRIARGNITIENNTLSIENNTYDTINLCEYLPYKNKKICDDSGNITNIKNIRYTEITHITFINCKLSKISQYYTGITHLTFIKCNNFKSMSRYLKAELTYLKINDDILINKTDIYSV